MGIFKMEEPTPDGNFEAASNIMSSGSNMDCKNTTQEKSSDKVETKGVPEKCCKYSREIKNLLSSVAKELERETQEFSDEGKRQLGEMNLKLLQKNEDGDTQSIWEMIQHLYTWPHSFEYKEYLSEHLKKELKQRFPDKPDVVIEQKAGNLLKSAECYLSQKDYKLYLTDKAEFRVVDGIRKIMNGRPGLLLRNISCKKINFDLLKPVFGEIVLNCQNKPQCTEGNHLNQCFDMECDIALIYPGEDKLHVRLGEAKKPDNGKLKDRNVKEASKQLVKDAKLFSNILKDIPSEKLDVQTFIILDIPESEKIKSFCSSCSENVLLVEDFESELDKLQEKLSIHDTTKNIFDAEIQKLFLSACTRLQCLIGEFPKKVLQQSHDWMIKYQDKVEKQLILFNDDQRKIMKNLSENDKIKNFQFCGGAGTGKTLMAVKCCNELLERYKKLGITDVHIYVTTMLAYSAYADGSVIPVRQFMSENINKENRDNVHTGWLPLICDQMNIAPPRELDEYQRNIGSYINKLAEKLKTLHQGQPVILIVDEIWFVKDQNNIRGIQMLGRDDNVLTPPGYEDDVTDPGSIVHLILAHNPASKGTLQFGDNNQSVLNTKFKLRYRSSLCIQKLSHFIWQHTAFPDTEEEHVPRVGGDIPKWIDLGNWDESKLELVQAAINYLKTRTGNTDDVVIIYDHRLPQSIVDNIKLEGTGTATMDWYACPGGEWDSVIYIGPGHPEVFSRARLTLGIITINCYKIYEPVKNILNQAVTSGQLRMRSG